MKVQTPTDLVNLQECGDIFDLVNSFVFSATTLIGAITDGIYTTSNSSGFGTADYWRKQSIVAFYLLRHALELSLKTLLKEIKGIQPKTHDVQKLWDDHIKGYKFGPHHLEDKSGTLQKAFDLLSKYHFLEDEQLFRYIDSGKGKLIDLPSLQHEDFGILQKAIDIVCHAYLCVLHVKKGYPLD